MRSIVFFLFIFFLGACLMKKQIKENKYHYKGIYGIVHEIAIRSDKTFFYKWQKGLNNGTIIGTYEKKGKDLLLNGGTKPPDKKIVVEESLRYNNDSIYLEVKSFDSRPLGLSIITLNDEYNILTDMNGKAVVKKLTEVKKINVAYLSLDIPEYKVHVINANHFLIQVYFSLKQEVYFENVRVNIKRGKLIMRGNPLSEGKPIILERLKKIM